MRAHPPRPDPRSAPAPPLLDARRAPDGSSPLSARAVLRRASRWGDFVALWKESYVLKFNTITSGLLFYLYNELSTLTIAKTSATTQSVANTAKRVIVIVGVAIALGESLEPVKMLGCGIGIAGVLAYSLVK